MSFSKFSQLSYQYLHPRLAYESIYDIDFGLLWDDGVRHLFFDVDNTLISYSEKDVSLQCINLFNSIQSIGFETLVLISNNSSVERIQRVAAQLKLPAVTFACKPFVFTMRRLIRECDIHTGQVAIIGDQLLTDVLLANSMKLISVFVDPIDVSNVSLMKSFQYKLQSEIMRSFYNR